MDTFWVLSLWTAFSLLPRHRHEKSVSTSLFMIDLFAVLEEKQWFRETNARICKGKVVGFAMVF